MNNHTHTHTNTYAYIITPLFPSYLMYCICIRRGSGKACVQIHIYIDTRMYIHTRTNTPTHMYTLIITHNTPKHIHIHIITHNTPTQMYIRTITHNTPTCTTHPHIYA